MKRATSTEARNRLGTILDQAVSGPHPGCVRGTRPPAASENGRSVDVAKKAIVIVLCRLCGFCV